uniref:Keratin n=1 Tax=Crocodylus porosus TaxID=8502 RepID=A0A7M4FZP4_CROPO
TCYSPSHSDSRCCPSVICPKPCVDACNWPCPCITSCSDSRAVVYPPPVAITFPGPILSSCLQESYVGTSLTEEIRPRYASGGCFGSRASYGFGSSHWSRQYTLGWFLPC